LVSELVTLRSWVEASIDFPDEELDPGDQHKWRENLRTLADHVERIRRTAASGNLLRDGIEVALVGRPNVGKSSLLNRLSGEELAIVTAVPGTTRDTVKGEFLHEGVIVRLTDTAGLREARDPVESIGIERTWRAARDSDVVLLVVDASIGRTAEDDLIASELPPAGRRITVFNKIDLDLAGDALTHQRGEGAEVRVSALTGAGIDQLRQAIVKQVAPTGLDLEGVFLARERHVDALARTAERLQSADHRLSQLEVFAEELRLAQRALGEITGELSADDLLGEIFSRFCIGK
jgi:tRNA modification GTPase